MGKQSGLKFGPYLLAVVLLGASATQASFAKQVHANRASGTASSAPPRVARSSSGVSGANAKSQIRMPLETGAGPKGQGVGAGTIAKGANSIVAHARDSIDTQITVLSPRRRFGPDKSRNGGARLKIGAPGNFQARRLPAAGRSDLVARNAIGLPVALHENMNGRIGERLGFTAASPRGLASARGLGGANIGRTNPAPIATASVLSRSKIDGAGLIRPALAPSGLGGPAKAVDGINGTTLRPKR
jgi:hypothetical protein